MEAKEKAWKNLEEKQFVDELKGDIFESYNILITEIYKKFRQKLRADIGLFIDKYHFIHTMNILDKIIEIETNNSTENGTKLIRKTNK